MGLRDPVRGPQLELIRRLADQLHMNEEEIAREFSGGDKTNLERLNRGEAAAAIDETKSEAGWE